MQGEAVESYIVLQCRGDALRRRTASTGIELRGNAEYALQTHHMIYSKCDWESTCEQAVDAGFTIRDPLLMEHIHPSDD